MSLWADYTKERLDLDMIENKFGFVSYDMKPPECSLEDIYIRPEYRQSRIGTQMLNRLVRDAKEKGCERLWSRIVVS